MELCRKFPAEVIAHRGFSGRAPENTLAAFEAAISTGADRVELDVLLSLDGVPVVIHDALLERTTDGRGPVCDRTFEDLRRLDAGSWFDPSFSGEKIPSLDEVLALSRGRIPVNLEIKEEAVRRDAAFSAPGIERLAVDALARHGLTKSAVVSSFEPIALERVKAMEPDLARETLYNVATRPPGAQDLQAAREAGSRALNISRGELAAAPGIVKAARAMGLGIKVYTVDDPAELKRLLELGVAGIFTNRPDMLAGLVFASPEAGGVGGRR